MGLVPAGASSADDLVDDTVRLALSITASSPVTVRATKLVTARAGDRSYGEDTELLDQLHVEAYGGADLREGVDAFLERPNRPILLCEGALPVAALDGLKVVDLTRYLSGPTLTMLLADLGADVVKVETLPHGRPRPAVGSVPRATRASTTWPRTGTSGRWRSTCGSRKDSTSFCA